MNYREYVFYLRRVRFTCAWAVWDDWFRLSFNDGEAMIVIWRAGVIINWV